jgi:hypothetical protein
MASLAVVAATTGAPMPAAAQPAELTQQAQPQPVPQPQPGQQPPSVQEPPPAEWTQPLPPPPPAPPAPHWPQRPSPRARWTRPAPPVIAAQPAPPPKPETWQASVGVRTAFIRSAGFDPFSENDLLPQLSLGVQRVLARRDALAFAIGVATDFGARDATARGAPSNLSLWRFTAVAEGRYEFWERGYGFLRLAPGMLHGSAEVQDASAPTSGTLTDDFNVLAADASAGAALRLSGPANPVAAWLSAEGGYGWAASHHLLLAPSAAARDQAKLAPLDLGTIDPRGVFMRFALLITY